MAATKCHSKNVSSLTWKSEATQEQSADRYAANALEAVLDPMSDGLDILQQLAKRPPQDAVDETRWVLDRLHRQAAVLQIDLDQRHGNQPGEELATWAQRYGVEPAVLAEVVATLGIDVDAVDAALGGSPPLPERTGEPRRSRC